LIGERELLAACLDRLHGRYRTIAVMVVGSAARHPDKALDLDLCAIVQEDVLDRARMRLLGTSVDLFVCGAERVAKELRRGLHQHLNAMFATGRHAYGEPSVSDELIAIARDTITGPAPAPSVSAMFAHRSKPFNLLRKFYDVRRDDPETAGLIVSVLVQASVDAYFALNRFWSGSIRQTVETIRERNPGAAEALQRVTEADLSTLCELPDLLDEMVLRLVGREQVEEETWITEGSWAGRRSTH
jgi:hypothetical protein